MQHFFSFSPDQNDATTLSRPTTRGKHDCSQSRDAQVLDLPHVGLDMRLLELLNGLDHQARAKL